MKKVLGTIVIILTLAIMVIAAGCGSVKISDIKDNPAQYEGKEVSIKGTVSETIWFSIIGTGAYQVDDGTGTIWVVTHQTPPDKGEKASAKGTVSTAVKIGDQSFGTVINETDRN